MKLTFPFLSSFSFLILLWTIPHLCTYRLVLLPRNMASREPPWPSGQKRERSDSFDVERESPLRIDTCLQTLSAISASSVGHQRNAQSSSTLESRQQNKKRRVISRGKSNNSKNTVQTTTKSSRTLHQGSTSSVGVLVPFGRSRVWKCRKSCGHLQRQTRAIWYRPPRTYVQKTRHNIRRGFEPENRLPRNPTRTCRRFALSLKLLRGQKQRKTSRCQC